MCKSINESSLLIKLEVVTELWIKAKQEPCDFYVELAELLSDFDQLYCRSYCYFGYIKAWCNLLTERNLRGLNLDQLVEKLKCETFVSYQAYFKAYTRQQRKDIRRHRENEIRNSKSLLRRLDAAIAQYSKSEVVRVDLAYLQEHHHLNGIAAFYHDLEELRKDINKRKEPFNELVDYAWALEQGETKGYHCHLLLIFNGHKRQKGWAIADKVGKLWKSITKQEGCYFNCHDPEQIKKYKELGILGIGRIHRDNLIEVKNMRTAGLYLVAPEKEAQQLRVKCKAKMRTYQ